LYDPGYVRAIGEDAAEHPSWASFAAYCRLRGEGLRAQALAELDAFIAQAVVWPLAERSAFCVWVGERRQAYGGQPEAVLPVPLFRLLVRPTLEEWAEAAPFDPWPLVWLARLSSGGATWHAPARPFLRQALARDPDFEPARLDFVRELLRGVAYDQHELPWGYLGDAGQDRADLIEAEAMLNGVNLDDQADLRSQVVRARLIAEQWLERGGEAGA
jgi:hypothetical protein